MSGHQDRHKAIVAVYGIFRKGSKILLIRRANTGYMDGRYSLPAGHVEPGEGAIRCLLREMQEEVGVRINTDDVKFVHCNLLLDYIAKDHERIHLFLEATKWQGKPRNMEPHKCDDLRWFDIDNLPSNLATELINPMQLIKQGVVYIEHNFNT